MNTYVARHKNKDIVKVSRSGGMFTAISDIFLNSSGVIYGSILNSNFDAIHIRATTKEERDKMRGSKYIQSKLGDCFKQVEEDLKKGKHVAFSGTPCQVAGLRNFLSNEYENLLCIDIICHGVPSPKVWHSYLNWQAKGKKVTSIDFRNKKFGWRSHIETINTGKKTINSEIFKDLFFGHNILRPSCYECCYKSLNRPGDITIGDAWGIESVSKDFDDDKGVSLLLINSDKGKEHFNRIKDEIIYKEVDMEYLMQPALVKPFERPKDRTQFWTDYNCKPFSYIAKKYGNDSLTKKAKKRIKKMIKKLFGIK